MLYLSCHSTPLQKASHKTKINNTILKVPDSDLWEHCPLHQHSWMLYNSIQNSIIKKAVLTALQMKIKYGWILQHIVFSWNVAIYLSKIKVVHFYYSPSCYATYDIYEIDMTNSVIVTFMTMLEIYSMYSKEVMFNSFDASIAVSIP